jgi:hypothetical protein
MLNSTLHKPPAQDQIQPQPQSGLLRRAWVRLFGMRARQLAEERQPRSWLAYVLMGTQGAALVLVFGHAEIHWLEQRNAVMLAIVGLSLFVLVATAIAAQNCAISCMRRVGVLVRNGAMGSAAEHVAYIVFVLLLEILTYAVAIYVLETNPQALLSDQPIIPFGVAGMVATIVVRAIYIGWTEVQLQIVSRPLPPQWETFLDKGKRIVGGHGENLLEGMRPTSTDMAAVARAYAEMSKPPVRRKAWWNGWLIKRDEEYRAALEEQAKRVAEQLAIIGGNRVAELEAQIASLREQTTRQMQAALGQAEAHAVDMTSRALTSLLATGNLPEWLIEARPELAGFTLTKNVVSRRKAANNSGQKMPTSRADAMRFFLSSLGMTPAKAPANKRGVWIKSSDIPLLSGEQSLPESPTKLAERLGDGATDGRSYIARLDDVMQALLAWHRLPDEIANAWASLPQSGENAEANTGIIALHA